ncbi:thermospermine synthase ACAULIS5-like, partial [Trifolium medium]|nr:thermospermine synthase ACAULIS5-like [Trifolium medium]
MGEAPELLYVNGFGHDHDDQIEQHLANNYDHDFSWYEEVIDDDLKWSFAL